MRRADPEASAFANSRNGTTPKTVATQVGDVELAIPRDRDGTFTPRLVPKGCRRLGGLDEMIISLYAGGMTVRDIAHHLATTIGHRAVARDDQQHHRRDRRGGPGLAAPPAGGALSGDLPRRDRGQGPRRRARDQQGRPHRRRGRHGRRQARAGDLAPDRPRARSSGPGSAPTWPTAGSATC